MTEPELEADGAETVGYHEVVQEGGLFECQNCDAVATGPEAFELFACERGTPP